MIDPPESAGADSAWKHRPAHTDLFLEYLHLVKGVVERMRSTLPPHLEADDLHSIGLEGLGQAIAQFSPEQADSFPSYASVRIRGAILDELRRSDWMSRGGRRQAKQVGALSDELEQRLGRRPTNAEIASEMSLSTRDFAALLERMKPMVLLELDADGAVDEDQGTLHDVVRDERQEHARDFLQRKERVQLLVQRMQRLSDVQRKILALYYFEELRMAEIAVVLGVTESRICQIHSQALRTLREQMTLALNR